MTYNFLDDNGYIVAKLIETTEGFVVDAHAFAVRPSDSGYDFDGTNYNIDIETLFYKEPQNSGYVDFTPVDSNETIVVGDLIIESPSWYYKLKFRWLPVSHVDNIYNEDSLEVQIINESSSYEAGLLIVGHDAITTTNVRYEGTFKMMPF